MDALLSGIEIAMIAATIIPLVRADAWWIRVFDFPRLQITAVLAATLLAHAWFRWTPSATDHVLLATASLCLVYQLFRMFPYTPLAPKQVQQSSRASPETTISLLISNVYTENRRVEKLLDLIRAHDPDVILTVETDAWWEAKLGVLEQSYSYVVKEARDNTYGMHLFSRLELVDPRVMFLIQKDVPSIHTRVRLRGGCAIELRCLHPRPPAPAENDRSTERDAEILLVAKELKGKGVPAIVIGDLNDVAWSRTNDLFQSISGLLDPRIGRGFFNSFNANWPLMRFPLDHAFSSKHFRLVEFKRLTHCGSDHFPVFVKLSLEPEAQAEQEELHANADEQQEARSKIDRAKG